MLALHGKVHAMGIARFVTQDAIVSSPAKRSHLRSILFMVGLFSLSVLNWGAGFLGYSGPIFRFDAPSLNTLFALFTLSLPWIVFVLLIKSRPFRMQTPLILLLIPVLVLVTLPAGLLEIGFSKSDEPLKTANMGGYRVGLHLLNCGAFCSFAIGVDQERVLIPPLMLSERLYVFDPASDAKTEVLGTNVVRVTTLPYNEQHPEEQTQIFKMKPYFFF